MSAIRTAPLKVYPPKATRPTLPVGAGWTFGAWTEIIPSAVLPLAVMGFSLEYGTYAVAQMEVQFGVGAAGAETSIGAARLYGPNSGNGGGATYTFRVPILKVDTGNRLAVRARAKTGEVTVNPSLALIYCHLDSTVYTTNEITTAPSGADMVSITPNASDMQPSAWVQLLDNTLGAKYLVELIVSNPTSNVDIEWELGLGAPGLPPASLGKFRSAANVLGIGRLWHVQLPALIKGAATTEISIRMRKSGTSVLAHLAALMLFLDTAPPTPPTPPTNTSIYRTDVAGGIDDDEAFQAFVKTKAYPPSGRMNVLGEIAEPILTAKATAAVLQCLADRDFGLKVTESAVDVTPEGAERHVLRKIEGTASADIGVIQIQLGDSGPTTQTWGLDQLTVPVLDEGDR